MSAASVFVRAESADDATGTLDGREAGEPTPGHSSSTAGGSRQLERFRTTELARGPWDPQAQHGGAPAALLMRALELLPAAGDLMISRVTYEFLRPVPIAELEVEAAVARAGRRVQLLEATLRSGNTEVARARALQILKAAEEVPRAGSTPPPPPGPEHGAPSELAPPYRPMFTPDAVEIRFLSGGFGGNGPSTGWFRLRVALVAGEPATPLQRLAAAGDFGNGISAVVSWDDFVFINPDLTLYIDREPRGEWIALEAQTLIAPEGIGNSESVLYDERGRVGRATQALYVAPR